LYGPKYVWFFIGWYEDDWFQKHLEEENINCTLSQMEAAAEGHFTTEALQWNQDHSSTTISGKVLTN
jgi:gamma-aminobutyric acid type B receptor